MQTQYTIENMLKKYHEDESQNKMNLLLLGAVGHGKTTAIASMPGPILIFSFDPSGTKSIKDAIATRKDIVPVTTFEFLSEDNARQIVFDFEKMVSSLFNSGEINKFKTVAIDSFTTFNRIYEWFQGLKDQSKNEKLPTLNDYQHINRYVTNVINKMCSGNFHFILTGHLQKEVEEMTGKVLYQLQAYPSMRTVLPMLFDYCWVVQKRESSRGTEHMLITDSPLFATKKRSKNIANTELPNLTEILKKIGGLDVESKPLTTK